jgi:hypothetical protein
MAQEVTPEKSGRFCFNKPATIVIGIYGTAYKLAYTDLCRLIPQQRIYLHHGTDRRMALDVLCLHYSCCPVFPVNVVSPRKSEMACQKKQKQSDCTQDTLKIGGSSYADSEIASIEETSGMHRAEQPSIY